MVSLSSVLLRSRNEKSITYGIRRRKNSQTRAYKYFDFYKFIPKKVSFKFNLTLTWGF